MDTSEGWLSSQLSGFLWFGQILPLWALPLFSSLCSGAADSRESQAVNSAGSCDQAGSPSCRDTEDLFGIKKALVREVMLYGIHTRLSRVSGRPGTVLSPETAAASATPRSFARAARALATGPSLQPTLPAFLLHLQSTCIHIHSSHTPKLKNEMNLNR